MIRIRPALSLVLLLCQAGPVLAQNDPTPGGSIQPQATHGPAQVALSNGVGQVNLPAGYTFLGRTQAVQFLEALGNMHNEDVLGVIGAGDAER